jgi:DNA-binding response OmpR family regulator
MHALIIEPQVFTSLIIEDALREAGYTSVAHATTEEEAIASAEREPPQLITAAIKLHDGSGVRAVETIRSRHRAPVLFITQRVGEVPAEDPDLLVVRKPFRFADLSPAIEEARLRQTRSPEPLNA